MKTSTAAAQILDLATTPAHKRDDSPVISAANELRPRWRQPDDRAALDAGTTEALRLVRLHGSEAAALASLRARKVA